MSYLPAVVIEGKDVSEGPVLGAATRQSLNTLLWGVSVVDPNADKTSASWTRIYDVLSRYRKNNKAITCAKTNAPSVFSVAVSLSCANVGQASVKRLRRHTPAMAIGKVLSVSGRYGNDRVSFFSEIKPRITDHFKAKSGRARTGITTHHLLIVFVPSYKSTNALLKRR